MTHHDQPPPATDHAAATVRAAAAVAAAAAVSAAAPAAVPATPSAPPAAPSAAPSAAPHLVPTRDAIRELLARGLRGPVTMLNLLRYRATADYAASAALAPPAPISGAAAYARYLEAAAPILRGFGADLVLAGTSSAFLIGPTDERWDAVLVARYPGVEAFLSFTQDPRYLAIVGHRTAALADSRLLPITEGPLTPPPR